jgi:hypothetical protein
LRESNEEEEEEEEEEDWSVRLSGVTRLHDLTRTKSRTGMSVTFGLVPVMHCSELQHRWVQRDRCCALFAATGLRPVEGTMYIHGLGLGSWCLCPVSGPIPRLS